MKTIIAGSRDITDYGLVLSVIHEVLLQWNITTVICGMARGVDSLGERWANESGVPVEYYPADWDRHGKRAGYVRNEEMADNADALIAIWDGESPGTESMIDIAETHGLDIFIHTV